ncbi:Helicase associated domain protein [Dactylosporangium sucinum]|uniref:Helicase C-terminal domain-containing protein n=1 Tax=Dactylosporangium sucinum TaxID=1424081 RepID=A0A917U402_9ACTN|nr:DEAD/DEAH box helicase [Dactylosporangium sucinum]GGM53741.1 hypothetical protein GCM10007977_064170 [Dactylosporangium sucinum]
MTNGPTPKPHQAAALSALAATLTDLDRVQLTMACGTGKTLVGRWHAEAADAQLTIVFAPSLALVGQLLGEWRRADGWLFEALVVCSDPSTAAGAAERRTDSGDRADVPRPYWASARAKVTTSPAEAARTLKQRTAGRPLVVFSTYHSAPVVAEAQAAAGAVADLAICDEAHRLAGRPRAEFRTVLDGRAVRARKRVFMTATPLVDHSDDAVSMDDEALFGPVVFGVPFGEAIERGLLADYQVLVVADDSRTRPNRGTTVPAALLDAVDQHGIRRMLSFHGRVAKAADFADTVDAIHTPGGNFIRAKVAHGRLSAADRAEVLGWLAEGQGTQVRVVTSARCLTEGIDVPAVDGVMFADQRSSIIDIVQAIGRVLRPAPGKTRGSIILPVPLPTGGDDDTDLALSAFGLVWTVLRGLREHDNRIAAELDAVAAHATNPHSRGPRPSGDRVKFLLPDGMDETALTLRLVEEVTSGWDKFYAATLDWAQRNNGARIGANVSHHGIGVGPWAAKQRTARSRGLIDPGRAERLEAIPGWFWDREDADWNDTFAVMAAVVARDGTAADHPTGTSRFAGLYACNGSAGPFRLGVWLALQRQAYRDGFLDPGRAERLAALPGWDWCGGLREQDTAMIQALKVFGEFERHVDVPEDHVEDGLPLGRWTWAIRRAHMLGHTPPALEDELAAACPRNDKGESLWKWEQPETRWRLAYSALRQYLRRVGAQPTGRVSEDIDGTTVAIGQWVARQRYLYRRGQLDARFAGWLESLPGWQWDVELGNHDYGDPIDLGGSPHGTAKGSQAKCPCKPCRDYSRIKGREHLARLRVLTDPVPAGMAAHHLARLETAGAKRSSIAVAAAVPLGVVRKLAAGQDRIERAHHDALLAVTLGECVAVGGDKVGSRGRETSTQHETIPIGPTRQILAGLAARGLGNSWVARELGYQRGLQLHPTTITRRVAEQIAELASRVPADLAVPQSRARRTAPPLAELLASRTEQVAAA